MSQFQSIWKKIEIPVIVMITLFSIVVAVASIITFDNSALTSKTLEKYYNFNYNGMEMFGFIITITRNLILWMAINLFKNNIVLSAILMIVIPRLLSIPFSSKTADTAAKQGVLKEEFLKLKKYYSKASEDSEVKSLYTQDSQRLSKKYGISSTENIAGTLLSSLPVIFVSFAVSPLIGHLGKEVNKLSSLGINITKPFIGLALLVTILMFFQSYLPMKNAVGPGADQQKQVAFILPVVILFVFSSQPALIPIIWLTTYIIYVSQMLYFHRIKKYKIEDL